MEGSYGGGSYDGSTGYMIMQPQIGYGQQANSFNTSGANMFPSVVNNCSEEHLLATNFSLSEHTNGNRTVHNNLTNCNLETSSSSNLLNTVLSEISFKGNPSNNIFTPG